MARAYAEMRGLRYLALRPFNVYGPRMDAFGVYTEVMIRWLERLSKGTPPLIFGDGSQSMDFVYITDVTPDIANQVEVIEIPEDMNVIATYPVATLRVPCKTPILMTSCYAYWYGKTTRAVIIMSGPVV